MILLERESDWRAGACVLALGMFDGLHLGHRALLEAAIIEARLRGLPCVACAFDAHPLLTLAPEQAPAELTPRVEKIARMEAMGVDALLLRPFTRAFANLTPNGYVGLLVSAFSPRVIAVGYNHRFGARGTGTPEVLANLGALYGFDVRVVERVCADGMPVSASGVRALLAKGDVRGAARMLGRWYALGGLVVEGKRIGRTLGFPTANVRQEPERTLPRNGVYVAEAAVGTGTAGAAQFRARAVLNIGRHPTLPEGPPTIEAHLLGYEGDLYGVAISLELIGYLRGERKFADVEALRAQVKRDINLARSFEAT